MLAKIGWSRTNSENGWKQEENQKWMEVGQWTKMKQTCKSTKVTSCTYNIENGWSQVCEQKWVEMPFAEIMGKWKEVKIDRSVIAVEKMSKLAKLMGASFVPMWLYVGTFWVCTNRIIRLTRAVNN